jgi:geranylgeranyl diphosphate synthase type I
MSRSDADVPDLLTAPVAQVLARARATVDPALRAAVATLPPSIRRVASYHLGWADVDGAPTELPAGKAIRPAIVLAVAEAVGGSAADAVPAAVAVELAHNFSLLHDDVMDGDRSRRHRATAWTVFGIGEAILCGDGLITLALDVLAAGGGPTAGPQAARLRAAVHALVEGQCLDLAFQQRTQVGAEQYVEMARGKTGALLGATAAMGGLAGGGQPRQVEALAGFGEQLGLAFQLVDDLLGIWGVEAVTGKPVRSDLRARKKSMPVVLALATGDRPSRELARLYALDRPLSPAELERAATLVEATGARRRTLAEADRLRAAALGRLAEVVPQPAAGADLVALARLATHRDR